MMDGVDLIVDLEYTESESIQSRGNRQGNPATEWCNSTRPDSVTLKGKAKRRKRNEKHYHRSF